MPAGKQIQNRRQTTRALHSIDWAPVGRNMEDLLRITVEQIARVAITDISSSSGSKENTRPHLRLTPVALSCAVHGPYILPAS